MHTLFHLPRRLPLACITLALLLAPLVCLADADRIYNDNSPSVVVVAAISRDGRSVAQGSGFVVREDGAVVTNYHVISGATDIKIKIGPKVVDVEGVLYVDIDNDVALLKMAGTGYRALRIGDPGALLVGQKVFAIGSPHGLENTISEGIVSGIREIDAKRKILQMTAAISPGSSGGPVFNDKGEVVGISTFLIQENQNLNFALPVSLIEPALTKKELVSPSDACQVDFTETAACFYYQGVAYGTLGDFGRAADAFNRALTADPKRVEISVNLGISYANLGRYKEALEILNAALKEQPAEHALLNAIGTTYGKMGKHKEAVATFRKSVAADANDAEAYYGLATTYDKMKRRKEALKAAKEAVRLQPESPEMRGFLGKTYAGLNMQKEAAATFKEGVRLEPDNPQMHLGLGKAYASTGNKAEALEEYKILKKLDQKSARQLFDTIYR